MSTPDPNPDLEFPSRKTLEHAALVQIRKDSLDAYARLHSIAEDARFVQRVREAYTLYPTFANLRCGAWYCDSRTTNGVTAHFKSSDGHYNGWSFNLRRPNLHLLPFLLNSNGVVLVDSTRSGKRMPDSLAKTVPIWCAVVNRAMGLRRVGVGSGTEEEEEGWDTRLYTPPQCVSKQEHSQIEDRIEGWASQLAASSYALPALPKPLRPIWITPTTTAFPTFDASSSFIPVICVSASRLVEEGAERRSEGYAYVQGAGDDHENWSAGLTPQMFWEHKDELLGASELEFPGILRRVIDVDKSESRVAALFNGSEGWRRPPTPIAFVGGLLSIATLEDVPRSFLVPKNEDGDGDKISISSPVPSIPCILIQVGPSPPSPPPPTISTPSEPRTHHPSSSDSNSDMRLEMTIPSDKKGSSRAFKACLPLCLSFIRRHLSESRAVCVVDEAGRDFSVAVVLVALQTFFDERGKFDLDLGRKALKVDKDTIRERLHWIIASRPEANPARATLKRVNEFFMSSTYGDR